MEHREDVAELHRVRDVVDGRAPPEEGVPSWVRTRPLSMATRSPTSIPIRSAPLWLISMNETG